MRNAGTDDHALPLTEGLPAPAEELPTPAEGVPVPADGRPARSETSLAGSGDPLPRSGDPLVRLARVVSEVLAPAVLVAFLLLAVGWHAGNTPGVSRWWGLPGALFAAVIPLGYVLHGVRSGRFTDHHIPERADRRIPLLFGTASLICGLLLLIALGAPRDVLALLVAGGAGLAVFAAVTHWWKMSIHAGVAAGTVAALTAVHGPIALLGVPLVLLGCWARVKLTAHTRAQVVVGALVGALIAGTVFPLLR
ncbi:phosphoesterase PA-phosphatase [Actinoplanes sp. DH11]|uniref:phosphoesterase PA-phosphatase n=1 Tax=Actinoplanes sp. DH11 TaxID=2857011 RepID=UPI001E57BDF7|nr:phosphoesterase PA-phosphatase [Actinoplanes sp. DH11]